MLYVLFQHEGPWTLPALLQAYRRRLWLVEHQDDYEAIFVYVLPAEVSLYGVDVKLLEALHRKGITYRQYEELSELREDLGISLPCAHDYRRFGTDFCSLCLEPLYPEPAGMLEGARSARRGRVAVGQRPT